MAPKDITTNRPREVRDDATRLKILELLLGGMSEAEAAGMVDLPRSQVTMVGAMNGWPHRERTEQACERFRAHLEPELRTVDQRPTISIDLDVEEPESDAAREWRDRGSRASDLVVGEKTMASLRADSDDSADIEGAQLPAPDGFRAAMVYASRVTVHPRNLGRDLGDLRQLAASIKRHGLKVPIAVEVRGDSLRLRDGERRLAAAKLAGVKKLPALIHHERLDDAAWLLESIDYNSRRQGYTDDDVRRVAGQLEELGVDRAGIADAFGLTQAKLRTILAPRRTPPPVPREARPKAVVSRKKVLAVVNSYREHLRLDDGRPVDAELVAELVRALEEVLG